VIGELDIGGIFLPMLLGIMAVAYGLFLVVHAVLNRLHFYRLVWHRALFNIALYTVLLGAVDVFCRSLML
jgi:hypothetical protein